MKKIVLLFSLLCGMLGFQNCSIDNYDAPDTTLIGKIVDTETNETVQTQYQNGAKIRLYELYNGIWSVQPNDFWVKQDGTFENKAIFAGKYKVVAEGPFAKVDTIDMEISGTKVLEIKVTPYLRLSIDAQAVSGGVNMSTKISRSVNAPKIKTLLFLCAKTPYVDKNTFGGANMKQEIALGDVSDAEIVAKTYTGILKELPSGTYYVRVGALADNSSSHYNYSKIVEVKVP